MPVSVDVWSFARALLMLAERKACCTVAVYTERGACRLRVERGALIAVLGPTGHDDSLGDVLLRSGDLDARKHMAALVQSGDGASAPIGAWLLAQQLATRGAVLHALRAQLRGRMRSLLGCREISYAVCEGDDARVSLTMEEPPSIADVLMSCLRAPLRSAGAVRDGELRLSGLGRTLLRDASLWPEEEALAALLLRGEPRATLDVLCRTHPRALGLLSVLESLGGFAGAVDTGERASYRLLLRKRNQIRQGDSPYRLLDLPKGASSSEARKALRKFALQLHPDALGPAVPDALRKASSEVMGALIDAERALRAQA